MVVAWLLIIRVYWIVTSREYMPLVPLPVIVPLFAAVLIAALKPLLPRKAADGLAITATVANIAVSAILLSASRADTIVYWLGNWAPRNGIALGICFTVDPLGAG